MTQEEHFFKEFIKSYLFTLKYLQEFISVPAHEFKISFDQFLIMHEISESPTDITLMDISSRHRVSRSAISRQISVLMDRKFVNQVTDENDRRRKILSLTDEGNRVQDLLFNSGKQRAHEWLQIYGADKLNNVLSFIDDFSEEVVQKEDSYLSDRMKKTDARAE